MNNRDFDDLDMVDTRRAPADLVTLQTLAKITPRKPKAAKRAVMKLARDLRWAEDATYPVEDREGGTILCPSVRFARPFAMAWTHLSCGARIVAQGVESQTVEGWGFDAQTGTFTTLQEAVLRSEEVWDREHGRRRKRLDDQEYRAKLYRVAAILKRRVLLDMLPAQDVADVMAECERTLEAESARALNEAGSLAVVEVKGALREIEADLAKVEAWLGHPLDALTPKEHSQLMAIVRSVKAGDSRLRDHFGAMPDPLEVLAEAQAGEQPSAAALPERTSPPLTDLLKPVQVARTVDPARISDTNWRERR